MTMERRLFDQFRKIIYEQAGIDLREGKEALVDARVAKRLRQLNIESPSQYLKYLEEDKSGKELVSFLDAISTNFTFFFRENDHFDSLAQFVKERLAQGQRRFRIWSAASSTGEEPYSIAITLMEIFDEARVDFMILATDISSEVLTKAKSGFFSNVDGLSKYQLSKYFHRGGRRDADKSTYQINDSVKKHVVYKRMNLSKPPFPMPGPLDVVFCRNVMIYFDRIVRQGLITDIERMLGPGGMLMIGHTETLTGIQSGLSTVKAAHYKKPGKPVF